MMDEVRKPINSVQIFAFIHFSNASRFYTSYSFILNQNQAIKNFTGLIKCAVQLHFM
jgi:hypothetical protein